MLTGFLPAPCSLWALSKEMPQNSASFKWICRSGRSVFFLGMWLHHNHRRCTLLSCSSRSFCVCASFEMGLIWIFLSRFPQAPAWDVSARPVDLLPDGAQLPYVLKSSLPHFWQWTSFILCLWTIQRDMQPYFTRSLQFAALSGIPPGVFALMQ